MLMLISGVSYDVLLQEIQDLRQKVRLCRKQKRILLIIAII